jgi:hypothetical protein
MKRKGNIGLIIGIVIAVVLLGAGYYGMKILLRPAPMTGTATHFTNAAGDIDRSGIVDGADQALVQMGMGCTKSQTCWSKVIGKTKDGDNPIYILDTDLNHDGVIDQTDLDLVK